ncbi:MAG: anaerobic ribonucleoside-triphosphate reductase activating protein [Candidatus Anammoxibacter sp.]
MIPIKGFIKNSMIEWEGKIAAIVFLSQCNLRCQYCHSPHLVNNPNELENIPTDSVLECLSKNRDWIDGVVISGGEPTLCQGLDLFIKAIRNVGAKVKLDTNGTKPNILENLIDDGLIDYIAMDIKAPLVKEKYEEVTGVTMNVEDIKKSIDLIMNSGIDYEFRTTVCPSFLDKDDVEDIALSIKGAKRYIIQQFRPKICLNDKLLKVVAYSEETLEEICENAGSYVERCWIRGKEKVLVDRKW